MAPEAAGLGVSLRLGVERADRPLEIVATTEARVIRHELTRRLADVTVDLRIAGTRLGPWLPLEHAAWPAEIDHRLDVSDLWGDGQPPLATLFARTVHPDAADVRRRMLRHLGVIPHGEFTLDDEFLAGLPHGTPRPLDLWLIAGAASSIEAGAADGFARRDVDHAGLDTVFDALVASVDADHAPTIARLTAERDASRLDADGAADSLRRVQADIVDRLDALQAENDVLRERLERAELHHPLDA